MADEKNESMNLPNSEAKQEPAANVESVDVETVMKGTELVKSKYELLYADIIEEKKGQ